MVCEIMTFFLFPISYDWMDAFRRGVSDIYNMWGYGVLHI